MTGPGRGSLVIALLVAASALALPAVAAAHAPVVVDGFRLSIGWAAEPAYTGAPNAVQVDVLDSTSAPVPAAAASLAVDVSFGDLRTTLPLLAVAAQPGEYRAILVPTRPGTYAFRVTGTLRGSPVAATVTCSDSTFDCVTDASAVQFPVRDPSAGQLAERIARALPRAEQARSTATQARLIAIVVAVAAALALALAAAIGLAVRRRARAG